LKAEDHQHGKKRLDPWITKTQGRDMLALKDYVGRYTHRVAISNNRLLDIGEDKVTFRYKDYRHDAQQKTMTLEAEEFIRRFLLHVLPEGFQRIRYYGFLANRYRKQKLAHCRELLDMHGARTTGPRRCQGLP
jgi:hypothetical protein